MDGVRNDIIDSMICTCVYMYIVHVCVHVHVYVCMYMYECVVLYHNCENITYTSVHVHWYT